MMRTTLFSLSALLVLVFAFASDHAAGMQAEEPKLLSLFPSAGMRGATIHAEVRGNQIGGAYAVWFDDDEGLSGRVLKSEEVQETPPADDCAMEASKNPPRVYRVSIEVRVGQTTGVGNHSLRLVSPSGVSDAQPFRVLDEPVVLEATRPHQNAKQAQQVTVPALITGRVEKPGELDY